MPQAKHSTPAQSTQWLLYGVFVGSVTAYFFDPAKGRRRRALLRDQMIHYRTVTERLVRQKSRHAQNLWQGLKSRVSKVPASPINSELSSVAFPETRPENQISG